MPKTIVITDIDFQDMRLFQDAENKAWAVVGFIMLTDTGDRLTGDETVELTGAVKTRAGTLLQDVKALIRAKRGI